MNKIWKVIEVSSAAKELLKLPVRIQLIYRQLVEDLESEGPKPYGWDVLPLQGGSGIRIRLNREYRVIIEVIKPISSWSKLRIERKFTNELSGNREIS